MPRPVRDYVSRDLFKDILDNEEEHVDTLERQFDMIARMGLENYIQLNAKPSCPHTFAGRSLS
jgi:bacterioferritin